MNHNLKEQFYNEIMRDVARIIKRHINESVLDNIEKRPSDSVLKLADSSWKQAISDSVNALLNSEKPGIDLEQYTEIWKPENTKQLKKVIDAAIKVLGNNCSLNWIDTSKITNMNELFAYSFFNGDISKWDTSNVRIMKKMFMYSHFNGDISLWNVSKVYDMEGMFYIALYFKDCSLNNWDVSNVVNMGSMFYESPYNKPLDRWDVSSVENMAAMFRYSDFDQDISMWDLSPLNYCSLMFASCAIRKEYLPKLP